MKRHKGKKKFSTELSTYIHNSSTDVDKYVEKCVDKVRKNAGKALLGEGKSSKRKRQKERKNQENQGLAQKLFGRQVLEKSKS